MDRPEAAQLFVDAMSAAGMTVRALSAESGVSTAIIAGMRNGTRDPQASTLRRLADALGTTMDALWPSVGQ
jgi:transcriptional regulator with XRE-family HTH domain